jgi:four helix bundle protein
MVPAKIANASGRIGASLIVRMLNVALGANSRLENLLMLARDLGLLTPSRSDQLAADVSATRRTLTMLIRRAKPTFGKKVVLRPADRR